MTRTFFNNRGITVIGATVAAAVLGVTAVTAGILIAYANRAKLRAEAKVSVIDNESALSEVVVARMLKALSPSVGEGTCLDSSNFSTEFNNGTSAVPFPDPSVAVTLVTTGTLFNNLNPAKLPDGAPAWFSTAAASCNQSPKVPAANSSAGVYLFCVRISRSAEAIAKSSTNFLDSQIAFAQFRVELSSQTLPHQQKVFGIPGPNNSTLPAIPCADWRDAAKTPRDQRQIKASYRIFWKRSSDNQGYYQYMGSKILNVAEMRGV
ncbi:hypothetical protein EBR78_04545 [bacterium]|nr:hypothetical protein [bacterium]NBX83826.1 hypothetical protein [bacterium]